MPVCDAPGYRTESIEVRVARLLDSFEMELSDSAKTGSLVDNTDDPVRMYLMQMGEIPLLKRVEEIDAAQEIEQTRTRYRHSMLANDFVLQGALQALQQVRDGQLRLDRTIEVSVTNTVGQAGHHAASGSQPEDAASICWRATSAIFSLRSASGCTRSGATCRPGGVWCDVATRPSGWSRR